MRPISDLQRRVEPFQVISDYVPAGDQPAAIAEITKFNEFYLAEEYHQKYLKKLGKY